MATGEVTATEPEVGTDGSILSLLWYCSTAECKIS